MRGRLRHLPNHCKTGSSPLPVFLLQFQAARLAASRLSFNKSCILSALRSLRPYFRRYATRLSLGITFVAISNFFAVLAPMKVSEVIDRVAHEIPKAGEVNAAVGARVFDMVLWAGLALLGLALLRGVFMFMMRQTIIVMSRHIEYDQKNEAYAHLQKMDTGFFRNWSTGDLMNRIAEDVGRVRQYTGPAVMYAINLTVLCALCLVSMARVSPLLTLFVVAPLPLLALVIFRVNKIINQKSEHIQAQLSGLTTTAQETYSGIRIIKSFVQEKHMRQFFGRQSDVYKDSAVNLAMTEAFYFPAMNLFIGLSLLATVGIGGWFAIRGLITPGDIAGFVMYLNLMLFPISSIGWVASMTQRAAASQKRIDELMHTQPTIVSALPGDAETRTTTALQGDVRFEDVTFTYPNTGITALRNLSLHAPAGSRVLILGRTGSGKSTVAQLLLRMYDPQTGAVRVDGRDVREWPLPELRRGIAYAPQDSFLFSDSIRENIRFGHSDAGDAEVLEATRTAALDNDLAQLRDGMETVVGERGVMLSGGQKQRSVLARALLKPGAPILVLDETLSAVDTQTEHLILSRLNAAATQRTVIVVAHRIFTGWNFDQILVLDDGAVAERGTHELLLAANGYYARLWKHQTAN